MTVDEPPFGADPAEVLDHARSTGERNRRGPRSRRPPGSGRPSLLTPEVQDRIVDLILDGAYQESAAVAAGVGKSTFYVWKQKGESARVMRDNGEEVPETDVPYLEFLEAINWARAKSETQVVATLQRAALGEVVSEVHEWQTEDGTEHRRITFKEPNVRALTTFLERSFPERYSRRVELAGPEGAAIPLEVEMSARDVLKDALGLVAERLGVVHSTPDEAGASDEPDPQGETP